MSAYADCMLCDGFGVVVEGYDGVDDEAHPADCPDCGGCGYERIDDWQDVEPAELGY